MAIFKLGELEFKSKAAANRHYSDILQRSTLNKALIGDDFSDVFSLLMNHPKASDKIGCGVESIYVKLGEWKQRCFVIIRNDRSEIDFGMNKCLHKNTKSISTFMSACRKAVGKEIFEFKLDYFQKNQNVDKMITCQTSGKKIKWDDTHVDHREPFVFSVIVYFFIDLYNIDVDKIYYTDENIQGIKLKDVELENNFASFHRKHAKLRLIDKKINMSKNHLARLAVTKKDNILKQRG